VKPATCRKCNSTNTTYRKDHAVESNPFYCEDCGSVDIIPPEPFSSQESCVTCEDGGKICAVNNTKIPIPTPEMQWKYKIGQVVEHINKIGSPEQIANRESKIGLIVGLDPEPREDTRRKPPAYFIRHRGSGPWFLREEQEIIKVLY